MAKAVNCLAEAPEDRPDNTCPHCVAVNEGRFLDLIEIDAASNTSVDDVRDLRDKVNFAPNQGRYKVYVVDETHMLSNAAFNALLKTLEEPPPHVIFILATTESQKVPATITSRCQRFDFRRISVAEIAGRLGAIARAEGLSVFNHPYWNWDNSQWGAGFCTTTATGACAGGFLQSLTASGQRIFKLGLRLSF